jgi:hypothetical protein
VRLTLADWRLLARLTMASYVIAAVNFMTADTDTDPIAASAVRKSEDRLRTLHPHAMARHDRLRADGMTPLDSMRETAPLFSRSPGVRVGDPAPPRPALTASTGQDASPPADQSPRVPAEPVPEPDAIDGAELRGAEIIRRMQSSARAAGRPEVGSAELALVLESATNPPPRGDRQDHPGRDHRRAVSPAA